VKNAINTHFLHDHRQLTDACNKDFIALVQLRGTFSTKNNAMNTHFLHDRRKKMLLLKLIKKYLKKYILLLVAI
jgi:hypothetical protein